MSIGVGVLSYSTAGLGAVTDFGVLPDGVGGSPDEIPRAGVDPRLAGVGVKSDHFLSDPTFDVSGVVTINPDEENFVPPDTLVRMGKAGTRSPSMAARRCL